MISFDSGYLRLISFEYKARALTLMLDLIDENSWELDEIDKEESYDSLRDLVPEEVFDGIFSKYTVLSGRTSKDGTPLYRYIEEKTCKFLAQVLLAASPSNDYNEFMEAWRIGTPESKKEIIFLNFNSGIYIVIRVIFNFLFHCRNVVERRVFGRCCGSHVECNQKQKRGHIISRGEFV